MRKILIFCVLVLMISLYTGCDITNAQTADPLPEVAVITPKADFDDSFNQLAYEGILKAAQDYDFELILKETGSHELYLKAISEAAKTADLVIALGHIEKNALLDIAEGQPDTLFAIMDTPELVHDNIMSISFKDEEGAFLVGVISALTSETGVIGFVGGVRDENTAALEYGFRTGAMLAEAAEAKVEVISIYTGTLDDVEAGVKASSYLIDEGADVIFHGAGKSGMGVVQAAEEAEIWTIHADYNLLPEGSQSILCSMFKKVDSAVYLSIQSFMENKFKGGIYRFGLDFEAVGYTDENGNLTKEFKKEVDGFAKDILLGNLVVPRNRKEFKKM